MQLKNVKWFSYHSPIVSWVFHCGEDWYCRFLGNYISFGKDRPRDIRGCGVFDAVWGTGVYRQDNWTAIGRSITLFYNYTQTNNIKAFWLAGRGECTVKMLLGWVVASHHLLVHVPHS